MHAGRLGPILGWIAVAFMFGASVAVLCVQACTSAA